MDIPNCAAIVTGAGSGMGFAAARALAARGAKVALVGRRAELIEERAREIDGVACACDVGDEAAVEAMFDRMEAQHGPARILIHAAADARMFRLVSPDAPAASGEAIRKLVTTNVLGTLYLARGFASRIARAPCDREGLRGIIINVSSTGAADGVPGSAYCASKGAVDAMTLSLARELSHLGVRVMTIAPGGIDTELFRAGAVEGTYAAMRTMVPSLARTGRPDEFARLAIDICENDYLNASIIRLDGGLRIPFALDLGGDLEPTDPGETLS